ncbi:MAG TPA: hypothetical protein VFI92_08000 [Steroidobacteraceae bacterium]|nr:hypothetical protein [Steroidobacteraceae bacterium]
MTVKLPLPFANSRGLGRGNPLLGEPCVALDVVGLELEAGLYAGWRRRIEHVARALGWPVPRFAMLADEPASTLCFTVPVYQVRTAREANEWAFCASVIDRDPCHWGALHESLRAAAGAGPPDRPCVAAEIDQRKALERLRQLGAAEADTLLPA